MSLSHLELRLLVLCGRRGETTTMLHAETEGYEHGVVETALGRLRDAGLLNGRRVMLPTGRTRNSDGTWSEVPAHEEDGWWTTEAGLTALDTRAVAALSDDDARPVPRMRLYLMPDYSSSSLWWEGGGMVQLDGLPLTPATKEALEAWSGQMYRWLNGTIGDEPFDEDAYHLEMDAEEDRLIEALRSELPARYQLGTTRMVDGKLFIDWE